MPLFNFKNLAIAGLCEISPFYMEDERGYFQKNFEREIFAQNGITLNVFESLESKSRKNVLRGLHFQTEEPQSKLVRVIQGEIFDVAVDLREGSATFGKWASVILSGENRKNFFIPSGFAHGFLTLSDTAVVSYCCGSRYNQDSDGGIAWNDSDLAIKWPLELNKTPIVSDKDSSLPCFKDFFRECNGLKG